jgi:acyl-coenzyme A synthetase/AMP-(fatty) acid ligase
MTDIPLLRAGAPEDVIAWRRGQAITRAAFLRDVAALIPRLPQAGYVLNHCEDRYHFLVCLAASLQRGQISLFPPSRAQQVLEKLKHDYVDVYCLTDQAEESVGMAVCVYTRPASPEAVDDSAPPVLAFPADRKIAIAFTSGSTGEPKRYLRTWGALLHETRVAGRRLGLAAGQGGYVVATVPPQHMYGFVYSVMLPIQFGYVLEAERPFYPDDIRRVLASHAHPGILVTTPVHIRACVLDAARLPPLAFILTSTAPLDKDLAAQAERDFSTRVMEFYGSTETGAIASRRQADSEPWRVFDDIHVSQDEAGFRVDAAYFTSPMLLSDSVQVLNDKEFVLYGRNTDLIKIAGKRISLGDLNRHLLAIEGVQDGTFFLPDASGGREARLTAFVVAPGRSRDAILKALRQHIDPVFLPRPLRLVESLPRNATGKLPRANLMRLLQEWEERETTGLG